MWHLDIPTQDELRALAKVRGSAVVSLYLPTTPVTPHAGADALAFRNLVDEAVAKLRERAGTARGEVDAIAEQLEDLLDDVEFWATQAGGLGVITAADHQWTYRLPSAPEPAAHVSDRVHLLPLFAAAAESHDCHVLCLSEGDVRLIDLAADMPPQEVDVPGLPSDAASVAGKASIGDRSHSGRLVGSEGKRVRIRQYARAVDDALRPLLHGDDRPLVLVATQPIDGIFRQVCSYPHLVSEGVQASADRWSVTEVAEAVAPVLLSHQEAIDADVVALVDERRGQGRVAEDLADIARGVTAGAVDTLVIDRDHDERGTIDEAGALTLDPEAGLVADELARLAVLASGTVLAVEASRLPGESAAVAVLRYSL